MARLDRYILRQVLLPFLTAVLVVVLLVFLFQARRLASAALGLGLTLEDAVVIFGAALPPFLVMAVPIAYLMAVLRGGGHRLLAEGFATTRSWLGLVAANLTGVALATSQPKITAATTTVWLADTAWRAARVGFGRRALTGEHGNQER